MPFESALTLAAEIRNERLTAREVVEAHLARIDRVNPLLNAVVARNDAHARSEADRLDTAFARGGPVGPLHGVPITVKDSLDTEHFVSTASTEGRRDHRPDADATAIARLRQAGAIVLGKTNTPELTLGVGTNSPLHGRTSNPYDPARSPGGSSGGAAAIIAAGGSALDVGSDTGGSVREPAHKCGIAALKPTNGRVPLTGHAFPTAAGAFGGITTLGPMARYVDDVALALRIIAGPDGSDPRTVPAELADHDDVDVSGLRICWFAHSGVAAASADVAAATEAAATGLEARGLAVDEMRPAPYEDALHRYIDLVTTGSGETLRRMASRLGTELPGPAFAARIENSKPGTADELALIIERGDESRAAMLRWMVEHHVDAFLCPITPGVAELADDAEGDNYDLWSFEAPINLLGWPAGVVRGGTSSEGLPIGVQVVGRPWADDHVLALMKAIEDDRGGFEPPVLA